MVLNPANLLKSSTSNNVHSNFNYPSTSSSCNDDTSSIVAAMLTPQSIIIAAVIVIAVYHKILSSLKLLACLKKNSLNLLNSFDWQIEAFFNY